MAVSDESRERVLWILRSTIGAFPRPRPVHLGVLGGLPGEVLAYRTVLPQALMLLAPWWQFMSRHVSSYSSTVMGKPESGLVPYWSEHTLPAVDRRRADELVSGLYGFVVGGWRYSSDDLPAFREPDYLRVDPQLVLPMPLDHMDYPGVQGMIALDELRYTLDEARHAENPLHYALEKFDVYWPLLVRCRCMDLANVDVWYETYRFERSLDYEKAA